MKNQKVPTGVGMIVIIIIAVTIGTFVWKYEKNKGLAINKVEQQDNINLKDTQIQAKISEEKNADYTFQQNSATGEYYYNNTKYGFSLKFPKEWIHWKGKDPWFNEKNNRIYLAESVYIEIHLKSEGKKPEDILKEKDKEQRYGYSMQYKYLGDNDKYLFFSQSTRLHVYANQAEPHLINSCEEAILPSFSTNFLY